METAVSVDVAGHGGHGCEPTYEGWKPDVVLNIEQAEYEVASLPMRDGNQAILVALRRICDSLRAYL